MTPAEVAYKTSVAEAASEDELVMQELPQVHYIAAGIPERLQLHLKACPEVCVKGAGNMLGKPLMNRSQRARILI